MQRNLGAPKKSAKIEKNQVNTRCYSSRNLTQDKMETVPPPCLEHSRTPRSKFDKKGFDFLLQFWIVEL